MKKLLIAILILVIVAAFENDDEAQRMLEHPQLLNSLSRNKSPTARFVYSVSGTTVTFNASKSTDPDGQIVTYSWVFGEIFSPTNKFVSSKSTATHKYFTYGIYIVKLTVTDNKGATDSLWLLIFVLPTNSPPNSAPVARFTYKATNNQVDFNASTSSDDGTITNYTWNFGEPSSGDANVATSTSSQISHQYAQPGNYTVTLTVVDNKGATGSLTKTILVASFSYTRVGPINEQFDARSPSDPAGSRYNYSWNFGDSTPDASGAVVNHTFAYFGTFTVTLTITNINGSSATSSQTVVVMCNGYLSAVLTWSRPGNVDFIILTPDGVIVDKNNKGFTQNTRYLGLDYDDQTGAIGETMCFSGDYDTSRGGYPICLNTNDIPISGTNPLTITIILSGGIDQNYTIDLTQSQNAPGCDPNQVNYIGDLSID